ELRAVRLANHRARGPAFPGFACQPVEGELDSFHHCRKAGYTESTHVRAAVHEYSDAIAPVGIAGRGRTDALRPARMWPGARGKCRPSGLRRGIRLGAPTGLLRQGDGPQTDSLDAAGSASQACR